METNDGMILPSVEQAQEWDLKHEKTVENRQKEEVRIKKRKI